MLKLLRLSRLQGRGLPAYPRLFGNGRIAGRLSTGRPRLRSLSLGRPCCRQSARRSCLCYRLSGLNFSLVRLLRCLPRLMPRLLCLAFQALEFPPRLLEIPSRCLCLKLSYVTRRYHACDGLFMGSLRRCLCGRHVCCLLLDRLPQVLYLPPGLDLRLPSLLRLRPRCLDHRHRCLGHRHRLVRLPLRLELHIPRLLGIRDRIITRALRHHHG